MRHLRIITRRRDRRIMGKPAESHTACGAPVTDQDGDRSDFRAFLRDPAKWDPCPACAAKAGRP